MLEIFARLCYNIFMQVDLSPVFAGATVAVATSGGCDSMALLHYLSSASKKGGFNVVALNVEHGIRGEESLRDTKFVKKYCEEHEIPVLCYAVDCRKKSYEDKLSLEEAARILRYDSFADALKNGKCDFVATAHHSRDNAESVLFNLFRGTGVKGLSGIKNRGAIIRPFIKVSKEEIENYAKTNGVPYVTDSTNLSDEPTRNFIRLNVLPRIREIFPDAEKSIGKLSDIAAEQSEYIEKQANALISVVGCGVKIALPADDVLVKTAAITAFKICGIEKDWEKVHADDVLSLVKKETGKTIILPRNVKARRDYDSILIYKEKTKNEDYSKLEIPFETGEYDFGGRKLKIFETPKPQDLKNGLYLDADKIPLDAVIRTKRIGDVFEKFGGGTKSLGDYLTDKKIPKDERDTLPLIASGKIVYAIFGVAISEKVKTDDSTVRSLKITIN